MHILTKSGRTAKAAKNIIFAIALEVVSLVSGFILPRLIIGHYGSDVNGLINSITAFIGYIALLQTGVGSVVISAFYRPLAQKNIEELSSIVITAERFFRKIAYFSILYIAALCFIYPIVTDDFNKFYTISLILIIGINTFAQYFFGVTYQMLLDADQCSYIYSIAQISTIILNMVSSYILITCGFSIQIVKLISSIWFVARPLFLCIYCNKKYNFDKNASANYDLIKQRWDGFGQGLAYFLHSKTDIFVLTLFSTLVNISIYSVYALVVTGLSALINCIDQAVRSAFGNIIAHNQKQILRERFSIYQLALQMIVVCVFSTAGATIVPFVKLYTANVSDGNYINYPFGILIVCAECLYCLRMPYNSIVVAAGHFKQTKIAAYFEAGINFVLSCILVCCFGLLGVAIGTVVAMLFRTLYFIMYLSKNILYLNLKAQIKQLIVNIFCLIVPIVVTLLVKIRIGSFFAWIVFAMIVFLSSFLFVIITNLITNKKTMIKIFDVLRSVRK